MKRAGFSWIGQLASGELKKWAVPLAALLALAFPADLQAQRRAAGGGHGGGNRASFSARSGVGVARFGSAPRNFGHTAMVNPRMNQNRMFARNDFHHGDFRHGDFRNDRFHHHHNHFVGNSAFFYAYPYSYYNYPYDSSYYDYPYNNYYEAPLDYPDYSYSYPSSYSGTSLTDVQSALKRQGYYAGSVDGVMGPLTRQAIRDFQRDNHLAVSGTVNSAVLGRLGLL